MPAILRNSLPKLSPLIAIIRPYAVYDRVGVRTAGSTTRVYGGNGMWVCNTMPFRRWVHRSVLRTSVRDYRFLLSVFLRYWAYASRPTMTR
jgi:hypothetical protein